MIVRIKIDGFKSLVKTDLFFGPFTCIIGANAIGKSNLFDALVFLSNLADKTLIEAAKSVRSETQSSNIRDIFYRSGNDVFNQMSFEVDMIIPKEGVDDLGQKAYASTTAVRYKLVLGLNDDTEFNEPLSIVHESLDPIPIKEIRKHIHFSPSKDWMNSVIRGRKSSHFISTSDDLVKLHLDTGGNPNHSDKDTNRKRSKSGRPMQFTKERMPRTLLSNVTAESPTAFLVRQEMRNWMMLQLEPSALRQPNTIYEIKNAEIQANGANLPATLYRLNAQKEKHDIYQEITNKVHDLIPDILEVNVDRDEKRDLLTLEVNFKDGLTLPAQSLSDGTLRFLGLAILEADNNNTGIICLEEPENGINPKQIDNILGLLQEIATDIDYDVDNDNPLRQVIINTHSTVVINKIKPEDLYYADFRELYHEPFAKKISVTTFFSLPGTWRVNEHLALPVASGDINQYVNGQVDGLTFNYVRNLRQKLKRNDEMEGINNTLFD